MRPYNEHEDQLAHRRRMVFLFVWLSLMSVGVLGLAGFLGSHGWTWPRLVVMTLSGILLCPLAFGATSAAIGFWLLRRGGDPVRINNTVPLNGAVGSFGRCAIVMPVFNEDVDRVFQAVQVMDDSLRKTGRTEDFDFFILSDSNDPTKWIEEERAWSQLSRQTKGVERIFYRKRRVPLHNKCGNIADFCRRWGANYRFMLVLDADSVMTGPAIVRLAQLIDAHPEVGIIQTCPRLVLGKTLLQRVKQFASHQYGPLFSAASNYWQMESATYWGHNAIIRVRPFMQHCAVPELPESCPLGRRILSHDTVEAALISRAGYEVWVAEDIEGSYEESPPTLLSSLQRDQRWCFGNLQHLWLIWSEGFRLLSVVHMLNGIMAYVSSPLWLLSLVIGTHLVLRGEDGGEAVVGVLGWFTLIYTMALLFLPKLLSVALVWQSPEKFLRVGGRMKVITSALAETFFSFLIAPILMLFHTRFVMAALVGSAVRWRSQKRGLGKEPTVGEIAPSYMGDTILALIWMGVVLMVKPSFLPWLLPILIGPALSVFIAKAALSSKLGRLTRRAGLFLIPAEVEPPPELLKVETPFLKTQNPFCLKPDYSADAGLLQVMLDAETHDLHLSMLDHRSNRSPQTKEYHRSLAARLLQDSPRALSVEEKLIVLWDADLLAELRHALLVNPEANLNEWWRTAVAYYNCTRQKQDLQPFASASENSPAP
jgi:membrane glycosyltransferase